MFAGTDSPTGTTENTRLVHRKGVSGVPGEGPYVVFWLTTNGDEICEAKFRVPGCPASIAAAEATVRLIRGRKLANVHKLEASDLLLVLGGLPDGRGHVADMCIEALRNALGAR